MYSFRVAVSTARIRPTPRHSGGSAAAPVAQSGQRKSVVVSTARIRPNPKHTGGPAAAPVAQDKGNIKVRSVD